MRVFQFCLFALCAFIALVYAADTENYQVASEAANAKGVTLQDGERYAIFEYWTVRRGAVFPKLPDCVTGYKHIRLVVGSPKTTRSKRDFVGQAWDLSVEDPEGKTLEGGKCVAGPEPWKANTSATGKKVGPNQYIYAGKVAVNDKCIQSFSDQFIDENPSYSLLDANCRSYAGWMWEEIRDG